MLPLNQNILDSVAHKRCCIIQDDTFPEKRSAIVAPASQITTEQMNYLLTISGGLVFVAINAQRAQDFLLPSMPDIGSDTRRALASEQGALVSVDAREGITTGISAHDRAQVVRILGAAVADPQALVKPGHVFPIQTKPGGLLVKNAMPEAALDLVSIIWNEQAAVYIDLLSNSGSLLSEAQQQKFATSEALELVTINQLVLHRMQTEQLVQRVAETRIPTHIAGELRAIGYRSSLFAGEHVALVKGTIQQDVATLTRVHSEQTLSDVFGGNDKSSRQTLHKSLAALEQVDSGILLYLRKPEAGSLSKQLEAKASADQETPNQLMREYGIGAQILRDLGARDIRLLSNTRRQLIGLDTFGINIVGYQAV